MTFPTLAELGELSLIEEIKKLYPRKSRDVRVGIGDDAAVLKTEENHLLVTTDMMVEGVHFDPRFITPFQLGFKLISVNVSDIYAMGGAPRYALLNISLRSRTPAAFVRMFLCGVKEALSRYRCVLVGGDLSSAKDGIFLSATVIGSAANYCTRSGARAGDRIYVTGNLGDSACGLHILKRLRRTISLAPKSARANRQSSWKQFRGIHAWLEREGLSSKTVEPLLRRHLLPVARSPRRIAARATSMIDVSDGLLIDLTRLCDESGRGARIYEEKIPVSKEMRKASEYLGMNPLTLAMTGGEDYELLFTVREKDRMNVACIGEITASERVIVNASGEKRTLSAEGYQHFRGRGENVRGSLRHE